MKHIVFHPYVFTFVDVCIFLFLRNIVVFKDITYFSLRALRLRYLNGKSSAQTLLVY